MSENKSRVLFLRDVHVEAHVGGLHDVSWAWVELNSGAVFLLLNSNQSDSVSETHVRSASWENRMESSFKLGMTTLNNLYEQQKFGHQTTCVPFKIYEIPKGNFLSVKTLAHFLLITTAYISGPYFL